MRSILEELSTVSNNYIPTFNVAISRISRCLVCERTRARLIGLLLRKLREKLEKDFPQHWFNIWFAIGEDKQNERHIPHCYIRLEIRFPDTHAYFYEFVVPDIEVKNFVPYYELKKVERPF